MRIAIIQPRVSYYVGGGEKVALRHAEYLSRIEGNKVDLFTVKPPVGDYSPIYSSIDGDHLNIIEKEIPVGGRHIYDIEPGSGNQDRWDDESILFNNLVHDEITEGEYDVVLSYYIIDGDFSDLIVPNVVYLGGCPRERNPEYAELLKKRNATISNSKNVRLMWNDDIVASGVQDNYILPKGADVFNELVKKDDIIVFAGRLIERKGVDDLVNAFSRLGGKSKLLILGDGPQKGELENLVNVLGLEDKVIFKGSVNNVQEYFAKSRLCVFPSKEGEGLMTVVAEAMMVGACVITTTGQGSEEIIKHKETGILISPNDTNILSNSMSDLLSKPEEIKRIGKNAKKYATDRLTWEKVVNHLNVILNNVVDRCD